MYARRSPHSRDKPAQIVLSKVNGSAEMQQQLFALPPLCPPPFRRLVHACTCFARHDRPSAAMVVQKLCELLCD